MLHVTASKSVQVPPEVAWEVLCDTSRYAEWVAATDEVSRTDGPAALGSTYEEVNPVVGPWKAKSKWKVVEFEPPLRQVHASADLPLVARFEVIMAAEPEGDGTIVTVTLRGEPSHGPLGVLFAKAMTPMVDRDNRKTVDDLAALLEREPASVPAPG